MMNHMLIPYACLLGHFMKLRLPGSATVVNLNRSVKLIKQQRGSKFKVHSNEIPCFAML